MDTAPIAGSGDFGSAALGASGRSFSGIGAPTAASGASTPSERGAGASLRGQTRRQDSTGSIASGGGGGGTGGLSVTGGSTAGAASESKQGGGEVSHFGRVSVDAVRTGADGRTVDACDVSPKACAFFRGARAPLRTPLGRFSRSTLPPPSPPRNPAAILYVVCCISHWYPGVLLSFARQRAFNSQGGAGGRAAKSEVGGASDEKPTTGGT